jgi:hypothetical protein
MCYRFIAPEDVLFFVHDCTSNEADTELSFQVFHNHMKQLVEKGVRFMWILLNKQDILAPGQREETVCRIRKRFEREIQQYQCEIVCKVVDIPGLSGMSGVGVRDVLDDVAETLRGHWKNEQAEHDSQDSTYQNVSPLEAIRLGIVGNQITTEKDGASEIGVEEFWDQFFSATLPQLDHRTRLRAGFLIILETLNRTEDISNAAEIFLSHLRRLKNARPERFQNNEHR